MSSQPTRLLQIVSHFPGRLRVRAEAFRKGPLGAEVAERVRGEPGVRSAVSSDLTGSLLVEYGPREIELLRLVDLIVSAGRLDGIAPERRPSRPPLGPGLRDLLDKGNEELKEASGGLLDARMAVPAALLGAGILTFILRKRRLPEWYNLIYWSYVTFNNLNPPSERR